MKRCSLVKDDLSKFQHLDYAVVVNAYSVILWVHQLLQARASDAIITS